MTRKYCVAHCPSCGCAVAYSDNPKDKNNIVITIVPSNYRGIANLCHRCKSWYRMTEQLKPNPKVMLGNIK